MRTCLTRIMAVVWLAGAFAACSPDAPSQCGQNVEKVVRLDFSGSSTIETAGDDDFEGYAVTVTIVRKDPQETAIVCYAVRDDDPFYKLFWAVDDVLDANFLFLRTQQDTRVFEGNFILEADDDEVCGAGAIPGTMKVKGCSGEREAEVYIHPYGSPGPRSPVRAIRLQ